MLVAGSRALQTTRSHVCTPVATTALSRITHRVLSTSATAFAEKPQTGRVSFAGKKVLGTTEGHFVDRSLYPHLKSLGLRGDGKELYSWFCDHFTVTARRGRSSAKGLEDIFATSNVPLPSLSNVD